MQVKVHALQFFWLNAFVYLQTTNLAMSQFSIIFTETYTTHMQVYSMIPSHNIQKTVKKVKIV